MLGRGAKDVVYSQRGRTKFSSQSPAKVLGKSMMNGMKGNAKDAVKMIKKGVNYMKKNNKMIQDNMDLGLRG